MRIISCLPLLCCLLIPLPAPAATPPNFVFILADDLGWRDLACYGSSFYETPNLDRLAREGMRFTDAYAACCVCSPTRASILTGKYPPAHRITDWIPGRTDRPDQKLLRAPMRNELALEEITFPELLQKAGYRTAFVGKWHLGKAGFWPENQGFDVNVGGYHGGHPPSYFSPYKIPTLKDGPKGEFLTDRLTQESIRFLRTTTNRPFLLYLSHYAVHTPLQAPTNLIEKYQRKALAIPSENEMGMEGKSKLRRVQRHATYAAMMETLDRSVSQILECLEQLNLATNTMVIFTSDNGGLSTAEGWPTSNLPLRAGKGWPYEGGVRVPLLVRMPGLTKPGSVCSTPVSSIDFFPTILDMAGARNTSGNRIDGVNITSILSGGSLPERPLFWHYPHYSNQGAGQNGAVRMGHLKLVQWYEDEKIELFDLAKDPGETENLAAKLPEQAKALRARLESWRQATSAVVPKPNPDYDGM